MESKSQKSKAIANKPTCQCGITKATIQICTKPANPEFCDRFKELNLNEEHLQVLMRKLCKEIEIGLDPETHNNALVKCFVTHVQKFPTGKECGEFLVADVTTNSLRILFVSLKPKKKPCTMEKIYDISIKKRTNTGESLFDYFAECLISFVKDHGLEEKNLPLGFSFNFPVRHAGESNGVLTRWVKGFNCPNVEGEDVVDLLLEALQRIGEIKIQYIVILNETIGTFMCGYYCNKKTMIGLTVGERCNACYLEKQENVQIYDGSQFVLIDTEWSTLGENGELDYLLTDFDKTLDENSPSKGLETFEKLVSYDCLGELVRLVLVKLVKEGVMFCGKPSEKLLQCGSFKTDYISQIEYDPPGKFDRCKNIINCKLGLKHHKNRDYINLRYICECFVRRAARLIAAAVATLLIKINARTVAIATDGVLFKSHPYFSLIMHDTIAELVPPEIQFELMPVEDGAGIGNAIALGVIQKTEGSTTRYE